MMRKDKPILFSAPMVRAILREIEKAGSGKTQTRRLLEAVPAMPEASCHPAHKQKHPQPYLDSYCSERKTSANPRGFSEHWCWWQVDDRQCLPTFKVKYVPGNVLWVRESWQVRGLAWGKSASEAAKIAAPSAFHYMATDNGEWKQCWGGWRPSIHMPRRVSRLTLEVTDVRVERLKDITDADAIAEGIYGHYSDELGCTLYSYDTAGHVGVGCRTSITTRPAGWEKPRSAFGMLWEKVNGSDAWDANPFVVAVTFRPHLMNIDTFLKQKVAA